MYRKRNGAGSDLGWVVAIGLVGYVAYLALTKQGTSFRSGPYGSNAPAGGYAPPTNNPLMPFDPFTGGLPYKIANWVTSPITSPPSTDTSETGGSDWLTSSVNSAS